MKYFVTISERDERREMHKRYDAIDAELLNLRQSVVSKYSGREHIHYDSIKASRAVYSLLSVPFLFVDN